MSFNSAGALNQKQGSAGPKKGPSERGAWSLAIYEMGVVRTVWTLFGWRKALKFLIFLPSVLAGGRNRSAYERIAPCETAIFGQKVILPHPDAGYLKEIVVDRCYTGVPGFEIGTDDVVVDLGANLGIFTLMAGLLARKGRVVAVEPEAQNYRFLRENLSANALTNIHVQKVAVSDHEGWGELHIGRPGSSTVVEAHSDLDSVQTIGTTTLLSLLSKNGIDEVDFLKMDIEGAEYKVFSDVSWLHKVRRLAIEVHRFAGDPESITCKLKENGYSVHTRPAVEEGLLYVYAKRPEAPARQKQGY